MLRVLARFAGTPGAKWFLCHLELGASPGQLYSRRIATGEIDFANSAPEPGLVKVWQTYMERKKRKMCNILRTYLESRASGKEGEEKLKSAGMIVQKAAGGAMDRISSFGSTANLMVTPKEEEVATARVDQGGDSDDDDDDDYGDKDKDGEGTGGVFSWDSLLDQGKLAAMTLGEYTVLAGKQKFREMQAEYMDRTLSATVLKKTPKSLQAAVENMNDNKSLLPANFHSSVRVHMF